ncbi:MULTISPECIES: TraB/GumN family protein [unclassified Sphingomonas]|jgi:uncharacterized protein YbaP (TraB family)|uniref:TraB/GumN family protein n=1 Tax=unclassified Sphingomonas TaxID=196159 RepID=UPI000A953D4B|nr:MULTISPECIES: TraB/GumN family protein [unclassified Sphingomonas]
MLRTILYVGAAMTLAYFPPSAAQPAPQAQSAATAPAAPATVDADPALWVVKDEDTTIYLFGTVHVLKPGLSWFDEAVKTSFDKSDEVVLELVMPTEQEAQQAVAARAVNPTGPSLTEKIPADKREAFVKALASLGIPAAGLDRVDPWFAATTLSMVSTMKSGYQPNAGAEMVISAAAKQANKPVVGLETLDEQLGFFDSLPEAAQIELLNATVEQLPEIATFTENLVNTWAAGDAEALGTIINDALRESPEVSKAILNDRNERWASWINTRLEKPGTVFIAVGAGHLAGPDSVQVKLSPYKVKAERIKY